jgi:ABC-type Fe3+ transport system permease subunit
MYQASQHQASERRASQHQASQHQASSNSQADLKLLLLLVVLSGLTLLGVGFKSIVHMSNRDMGLITRNLSNW